MDDRKLDALIARAAWTAAKSTEDIAPHEYVVLGWDRDDVSEEEFWAFVEHIERAGRLEEWTPPAQWVRRWGGRPMTNRYLYRGEYAYWFTWPRGRAPAWLRSLPRLVAARVRPQPRDSRAWVGDRRLLIYRDEHHGPHVLIVSVVGAAF